jgi:hypothetical protein
MGSDRPDHYREHMHECLQLARITTAPEHRAVLVANFCFGIGIPSPHNSGPVAPSDLCPDVPISGRKPCGWFLAP